MAEAEECPACGDGCSIPNWSAEELQWCSFPVAAPCTDWESVESEVGHGAPSDELVNQALRDIHVYVVQEEDELPAALDALYHSMQDAVLGVDTEWKPDHTKGAQNKTAMISLASSSCVVLVRTCSLGWKVPQQLRDFCKDEQIVGVGFNWDRADELKMMDSFDLTRCDLFSHFVDVKDQAELLGYSNPGLSTLSQRLLRFEPPKSKAVTMSNWEAYQLTPRQIRYAALDSLLTGDLFRKLRFMHGFPQPCPGCSLQLGQDPGVLDLRCHHEECVNKKAQASAVGLLAHAQMKQHTCAIVLCTDCGRISAGEARIPAPLPSSQAANGATRVAEPASAARPAPQQTNPEQWHSEGGGKQAAQVDTSIYPAFLLPTASAGDVDDGRREVLEEVAATLLPRASDHARGGRSQRQKRNSRGGRQQGKNRSNRQDQQMFAAYNAYT